MVCNEYGLNDKKKKKKKKIKSSIYASQNPLAKEQYYDSYELEFNVYIRTKQFTSETNQLKMT